MKRIPLVGDRGVALVDDGDFDRLAEHRWYSHPGGYVTRTGKVREGLGGATILMHRDVLGVPPGDPRGVDHRNFNGRDNQRANLRICSGLLNAQNCAPRGGSSRFRGVTWDKGKQKWQAQACVGGRYRFLGRFASEVDAALAAQAYRQEHMPFAAPDAELALALSFPPGPLPIRSIGDVSDAARERLAEVAAA